MDGSRAKIGDTRILAALCHEVFRETGFVECFEGYHAQQAVEKLYKALISAHAVAYPFIHDLVALRKLLEKQGEVLPPYVIELEKLTSFSGQFRYEQPVHLDAAQRKQVREWIGLLETFCLRRIAVHRMLPTSNGDRWV